MESDKCQKSQIQVKRFLTCVTLLTFCSETHTGKLLNEWNHDSMGRKRASNTEVETSLLGDNMEVSIPKGRRGIPSGVEHVNRRTSWHIKQKGFYTQGYAIDICIIGEICKNSYRTSSASSENDRRRESWQSRQLEKNSNCSFYKKWEVRWFVINKVL